MKKQQVCTAVLALSFFTELNAQAGINTEIPKTTLDVESKASITTIADGIMATRLTGEQLKDKNAVYDGSRNGAIVYVTKPLEKTSKKTVNVKTSGYYYYDGDNEVWVSMASSIASLLSPWKLSKDAIRIEQNKSRQLGLT